MDRSPIGAMLYGASGSQQPQESVGNFYSPYSSLHNSDDDDDDGDDELDRVCLKCNFTRRVYINLCNCIE